MSLFEHCTTDEERWHTAYAVACLVHPSQGGLPEDMRALCSQAREALADFDDELHRDEGQEFPNLFDMFCKATGTPNQLRDLAAADFAPACDPGDPVPYMPAAAKKYAYVTAPLFGSWERYPAPFFWPLT